MLYSQVRFILAVVEGRLQVNNRKKADLLDELHSEGYDLFLPRYPLQPALQGQRGTVLAFSLATSVLSKILKMN